MAQTHDNLTSMAPVSPSTSADGMNESSAGSSAISSSLKSQKKSIPNGLSPPITPNSPAPGMAIGRGRRADSKALPSSRPITSTKTPSLPMTASEIPTMNDIAAKIPNLLPSGYYQCAGISKTHSRCKRHIKNKIYCHSHDIQLLHAIVYQNKNFVKNTIIDIKSHRGPIEAKMVEIRAYLFNRHWATIHADNFEALLRNIRKGPLEKSERDQGRHALVPRWNRKYVCLGRNRFGGYCRKRIVGGFYCGRHDTGRIRAGDVEMAFAAI